MKYSFLIFDLDGTLVDSRVDLVNAVNGMLVEFRLHPLTDDHILTFIGKGARNLVTQSLQEANGYELNIEKALTVFKTIYGQHLLDHTRLFPGVRSTLRSFKGIRMAVISNKPVGFSEIILSGLSIRGFFDYVLGGDSIPEMKPSPEPLLHIMKQWKANKEETMIIGDSTYDIEAGRAAGIKVCAALYGFQDEMKLEEHNPDYRIEKFSDLVQLVRTDSGNTN